MTVPYAMFLPITKGNLNMYQPAGHGFVYCIFISLHSQVFKTYFEYEENNEGVLTFDTACLHLVIIEDTETCLFTI